MSFTSIKTNNQGFTIVELLIVVVVIAILAAITIVSYNGITNRANASAAKSTAATWQKKVELYQAEMGSYPATLALLTGATPDKAYAVTSTTTTNPVTTAALTTDNGKTTVQIVPYGVSGSTATGVLITYYTYGTPTTATISVGNATGTAGTGWASL